MNNFTVTINMDTPCAECRKKGACQNGLCMKCAGNAMFGKPMKSAIGQAVATRAKRDFKAKKK